MRTQKVEIVRESALFWDLPGRLHVMVEDRFNRFRWLASLLCIFISVPVPTLFAQTQAGEYAVKAAYLLNFAKYADWASPPARKATGIFTICLWKQDTLGTAADELRKRSLGRLKVDVDVVHTEADAAACDLLFFAGDLASDLEKLKSVVEVQQVITVTERSLAGILNFLIIDGQVRFDCNLDAAARSGIRLGSQLVKLAEHIKEKA